LTRQLRLDLMTRTGNANDRFQSILSSVTVCKPNI
jgi:hypothetical protein